MSLRGNDRESAGGGQQEVPARAPPSSPGRLQRARGGGVRRRPQLRAPPRPQAPLSDQSRWLSQSCSSAPPVQSKHGRTPPALRMPSSHLARGPRLPVCSLLHSRGSPARTDECTEGQGSAPHGCGVPNDDRNHRLSCSAGRRPLKDNMGANVSPLRPLTSGDAVAPRF